ncbi:MAG: universal stress protein [wastewater metagenome]|nr:universal stress protein [Candidatus Loosdrechtia aerotolerans]
MIYFKRILCPVDFSDCSMKAFKYATEMAVRDSAALYLLYVEDERGFEYGGLRFSTEYDTDTGAIARIEQKLRDSVPEKVRDCLRVEIFVTVGIPVKEILQIADNKEVDLIVMGTHGRTGIAHMVIGSVAESVIKKAPCPVLCIRGR